jgi:hypothetical protein
MSMALNKLYCAVNEKQHEIKALKFAFQQLPMTALIFDISATIL